MHNSNSERRRIRAARYNPGPECERAVEGALRNLPKRRKRLRPLAVASVATAAALLLAFTGPQVVKAAVQLYQRLFGQIVEEIEQQRALPEDERLRELVEDYLGGGRWHSVEGASAEIGGTTVNIDAVRTMPLDRYSDRPEGELDISLTYSDIPAFDPNRVDFVAVVDGEEIPMRIDDSLKEYRSSDANRLSPADWEGAWPSGNTEMRDGALSTSLAFPLDNWAWDEPKSLELRAAIGGETLSIPFAFNPQLARENAEQSARESLALTEENYQDEKPLMDAVQESVVPLSITGNTDGIDWALSEFACTNDLLFFTASFGNIEEHNPKIAGMTYWIENVLVDGMSADINSSDDDTLENGVYTALYSGTLMRDPGRLPEESIISLQFDLGGKLSEPLAFKYNWSERRATLPKGGAERRAWAEENIALNEALWNNSPESIGYDLRPLNLVAESEGISLAITGARFRRGDEYGGMFGSLLEFYVDLKGDLDASSYDTYLFPPTMTINGHHVSCGYAQGDGIVRSSPPLHITEFGQGERVELEFPLHSKDAREQLTGEQAPIATLRFAFTIDGETLEPLPPED